ncbi:MAG: prepilin peptidase, partial [Alphaproteobacteria bacterium]
MKGAISFIGTAFFISYFKWGFSLKMWMINSLVLIAFYISLVDLKTRRIPFTGIIPLYVLTLLKGIYLGSDIIISIILISLILLIYIIWKFIFAEKAFGIGDFLCFLAIGFWLPSSYSLSFFLFLSGAFGVLSYFLYKWKFGKHNT